MRAVCVVAALLLGACVLVLAQDTLTAVPTYGKAKHKYEDIDSKSDSSYDTTTEYVVKGDKHNKHSSMIVAKDGKDGRDGRDGKDGRDGQNGRDGRDAWITTAWRNGNLAKVNITSTSDEFSGGESGNAKHVVGQLKSTAVCESGEKAIACSCDTQMSSSAGKGFIAPTTTDYASTGEGWLERVNYITLVGNALSASPQASSGSKDTCTCTAMYVATVRGSGSSRGGGSSGNDDSWSEDDDSSSSYDGSSSSHHGSHHSNSQKKHSSKVVYGDDAKIAAVGKDSSSAAATTGKETTAAKPAYYYEDWTKKAPKWQAFELTATVTCQTAKLVPRPHHKDEYDYNSYGSGSEYDYSSKSDKYENKKYENKKYENKYEKETYGDGNSVKYDSGKDKYKPSGDKDDYFSEDQKSYTKNTNKHNTNKKDY